MSETRKKPRSKNAEDVANYRQRQRELGRKKREFYLTDKEARECQDFITTMRSRDNSKPA